MARQPVGVIDRLVNEYGRNGRWTELAAALDQMDRRALSAADQAAWYHARGIAEYRRQQRERAREIFEEGLGQYPDSGWLNFGLGQEYEHLGRIDDMAACFQRVRLADVGRAAILAIARYYYLWDHFALGQQAIQPIFDAYYQLKIVDDTFLYLRGLPMFSESFGYRAAFAYLSGEVEAAQSELARARTELHDYNFAGHQLELDATISRDWKPVVRHLEALLHSLGDRYPTGSLRMKRAVLLSRRAGTLPNAIAELDAVELSTNDHAWLNDIRMLARAEACHRLGEIDGERAALATFWPKQQLLFEPNHAFSFGFIDYQERLKSEYRARHRPN